LNDNIKRLEEKIAYLERHVVEQDKAMLELADNLARLRKELRKLQDRPAGDRAESADEAPLNERPPHY